MTLKEADYKFGQGSITVRVAEVTEGFEPGYVGISGVRIFWTGNRGPKVTIQARISALTSPASRE